MYLVFTLGQFDVPIVAGCAHALSMYLEMNGASNQLQGREGWFIIRHLHCFFI